MYEEKNFSTGSIVISFLVGGIVGAGVALLTAPQSGRETREKIGEMAGDAKDKIVSAGQSAKLKIADTLSRGRDYIEEKKPVLQGAVEAGKKAMEEEKSRLMSHLK
jgi:gas vesicle protein